MAHALSITDGTTTISLSGTDFFLIHYVPNAPSYRNGIYDNVVDNISLMTDTASGSASQTAVNGVEKLLDAARRRQDTRTGPRVYLQLQLDSDSEAWRSEVLMGSAVLEDSSLRSWVGKTPLSLVVTRVHYWEAEPDTLISGTLLTNTPGSNTTYTATAVNGSLPTPAIVKLTDVLVAGSRWKTYMGINAFNAPATWDGELANKAAAASSPFSFDENIAQWDLTDAELTAMRGDSFRFILTFNSITTHGSMWWQLQQYYDDVYFSTETPAIYTETARYIHDFLDMPVPADGYNEAGTDISLRLTGQSDTVDPSVTVDGQIYPADNFRKLTVTSAAVATDILVDDGVDNATYVQTAAGKRKPTASGEGNQLLLYPGEAHRFIWLVLGIGGYVPGDTSSVNITYRPRRLTI